MYQRNKAFTLAEVLITLTLTGAIAALTIPSIIANTQNQQYKTQITKVDAVLSQAVLMLANSKGGSLSYIGGTGNTFLRNEMEPYFNYVQSCDNGVPNTCFPTALKDFNGVASTYNGEAYTDTASLLLANGVGISLNFNSACNGTVINGSPSCGTILVDVDANNINNSPNTWGKDIYGFYILTNTLVPFGVSGDSNLISNCLSSSDGHGCAYPYIYNLIIPGSYGSGASCSSTTSSSPCTENNSQNTQFVEVSGGCSTTNAPTDTTGINCTVNVTVGATNYNKTGSCGDGSNSAICKAFGYGCTTCNSSEVFYSATADLSGTYNYSDAIAACAALNNNGVTGWHLPTSDQLATLYSQSASNPLTVDVNYGASTEQNITTTDYMNWSGNIKPYELVVLIRFAASGANKKKLF